MLYQKGNSLVTSSSTATVTSPIRSSPATVSLSLASTPSGRVESNQLKYGGQNCYRVFNNLSLSLSFYFFSPRPLLSRVVVRRPPVLVSEGLTSVLLGLRLIRTVLVEQVVSPSPQRRRRSLGSWLQDQTSTRRSQNQSLPPSMAASVSPAWI